MAKADLLEGQISASSDSLTSSAEAEMDLLNVALNCIRRGWYVFPCIPRTKKPLGGLVPNGWHHASNDETVIRRWWTVKPDANVAIACGPSGLSVVDCDHGNHTETNAREWMRRAKSAGDIHGTHRTPHQQGWLT